MIRSNVPGSHYYKIDLHIHTPASEDYKDNDVTGEDIVNTALDAGLHAIAITDHNDYRFIDTVIDAAKDTVLTVFPGVEISTRDGHLLAIFDPETATGDTVRTCLISCELRDKTEYGKTDTLCNMTIEDGGFCISHRKCLVEFKKSLYLI